MSSIAVVEDRSLPAKRFTNMFGKQLVTRRSTAELLGGQSLKQAISQESVSDSSHSCIREVTASSSSIKSAAMLGLALSVGASGVFATQPEASAAISIPEASATGQAFSSDSEVSVPASSTSPAQVVAYHTVASGQSLWQIAQLHRVGLQDLKVANRLPVETSIRVGQVLKVPSSDAVAQSPAQQVIQNLATQRTEPAALVATSNLALQNVETGVEAVAKAKISEQNQSQQNQTIEELEASEEIAQQETIRQEVPTLDEVQVSVEIANAEIASADVVSSTQLLAQAEVSADEARANLQTTEAEPLSVANPTTSTAAIVEFDIADASLAERTTADSAPVITALASPTQAFDSYQIQAGDTIADIADSLGTTAADLISVNDLADPDVIMPGGTLIVPAIDSDKVARQPHRATTDNAIEQPSQNNRLAHLQRTAIRQNASSAVEQPGNADQQMVSTEGDQNIAAKGGVDPHVANLLEEVQEIQSEPIRIDEAEITRIEEVSPSPRIAERVAIAPTQTSEPASVADPSLLAVAPLSPDAYIPAQRSPAGQLVSPDMPLLPEADEFLPEAPDYFNGYIWPTRGTLTSGYGWRWGRMHRGVDVAGPIGTPVVAAASGVIERAGWNSGGYGNLVEIRHPDGSLTLYAHNNRLNVSTGQAVKQGQKIAEMGSTGYSTGPHLHFEVHLNGKGAVNPIAHLPGR